MSVGLVSPRRSCASGTWLDMGLVSPRRGMGGTWLAMVLTSPRRGVGGHLFGCGVGVTWEKGCRWHLARHGNVMGVTHRDVGLGGAGCPHPDVQRQAAGPLSGGAAQAGGLQHVATAPIAQEAPGVQVHLIAWCLEVEGHCGVRRMGYQGG